MYLCRNESEELISRDDIGKRISDEPCFSLSFSLEQHFTQSTACHTRPCASRVYFLPSCREVAIGETAGPMMHDGRRRFALLDRDTHVKFLSPRLIIHANDTCKTTRTISKETRYRKNSRFFRKHIKSFSGIKKCAFGKCVSWLKRKIQLC